MIKKSLNISSKVCTKNIKYAIFFGLLAVSLTVWFGWKSEKKPAGVLSWKESYFEPFQLSGFCESSIPYITIDIEERQFNARIDLGFAGYVAVPPRVWEDISEKKFLEHMSGCGLAGKLYQKELYQVKSMHMQKIHFLSMVAEKLNLDSETDMNLGALKEGPVPEFGRIGWYLFRRFNLLIDAKHSMFAVCDSLQTLSREGYPVESFVSAPLLLDRGFLEFAALTSSGELRCILDTGSTLNLWNRHEGEQMHSRDDHAALNPNNQNLMEFHWNDTCEVANYAIGGKEFGPITFHEIKSPLGFEAIMGMDFFESHLVFVDFKQERVYFYKYAEEEK